MAVKFVVLAALVAVAHCGLVPVARVDADSSSFSYDVADPNTGDFKSQAETRVGGNVVGQYSLLESDGTKRVVDYSADDANGFNAVVRKEGAVVAAPAVSAPLVAATPAVYAAGVPSVWGNSWWGNNLAARSWYPNVVARTWAPNVVARPWGSNVVAPYSSLVNPSVWGTPLTYAAQW